MSAMGLSRGNVSQQRLQKCQGSEGGGCLATGGTTLSPAWPRQVGHGGALGDGTALGQALLGTSGFPGQQRAFAFSLSKKGVT